MRGAQARDGRFATLLDEDGRSPCDPADSCPTCVLFDRQRLAESRREYMARITSGHDWRACRCLACADQRRAEDVPPLPIQIGSISIPSLKPGRRGPRAPVGGTRGATRGLIDE